ncbi:hypothetical protein [Rickettsiales endosymbiont of Stachyamoeba lipophora]|uniref:hypothetical protein n=1 Tax=Rickettsiales endosymbiont of Stachyamoeba lipophora TaxID=2486578 RepID=UPI000F64BBC6|nr:hypothetical protein [Rickettsiales endosymbiont of Stachyamoeba lipophora]AZL15090.1 hypothetical protein EF513_00735 [Rickettsiales endosymbiont of Stachyamoeba lipophora]
MTLAPSKRNFITPIKSYIQDNSFDTELTGYLSKSSKFLSTLQEFLLSQKITDESKREATHSKLFQVFSSTVEGSQQRRFPSLQVTALSYQTIFLKLSDLIRSNQLTSCLIYFSFSASKLTEFHKQLNNDSGLQNIWVDTAFDSFLYEVSHKALICTASSTNNLVLNTSNIDKSFIVENENSIPEEFLIVLQTEKGPYLINFSFGEGDLDIYNPKKVYMGDKTFFEKQARLGYLDRNFSYTSATIAGSSTNISVTLDALLSEAKEKMKDAKSQETHKTHPVASQTTSRIRSENKQINISTDDSLRKKFARDKFQETQKPSSSGRLLQRLAQDQSQTLQK